MAVRQTTHLRKGDVWQHHGKGLYTDEMLPATIAMSPTQPECQGGGSARVCFVCAWWSVPTVPVQECLKGEGCDLFCPLTQYQANLPTQVATAIHVTNIVHASQRTCFRISTNTGPACWESLCRPTFPKQTLFNNEEFATKIPCCPAELCRSCSMQFKTIGKNMKTA
jgi:hypothetical protein